LVHGRDDGKRSDLIGSPSRAMSRGDFRLAAARTFVLDRETWDANATSDHLEGLEDNLRRVPRTFDFNVATQAAREERETRFVSFSKISQYCGCKFKYFLSGVLKVEEKIEELLELSPMDSGSVFHAVLSELPHTPEEIDVFLDRQLRRYSSGENESLFRLRKKQMATILREYIAFDRERTAELNTRPLQTELAFGFGKVPPLELPGFCMRGFIDRIDVKNDGTLFVIDYKSGKNASSAHPEQLVLYSMAVEQAYRGEKRVSSGEFRLIKGMKEAKGFRVEWDQNGRNWVFGGRVGFKTCETEKKGTITDDELTQAIRRIIEAIDAGDFSMTDWKGKKPNCFYCTYEKLCGILEWRNRGVLSNER
ncbi:MAG: PD-(D/E)XK nuclease family protein, partial [Synergistales bacterium]|nr:PD-(D/E)XK nuclease family protein [Synergistales bacterium]